MALLKSISGIRGTIGGINGDNLTPIDIVKFSSAYGHWLKKNHTGSSNIVIGKDARISGEVVEKIVVATLQSMGFSIINIGLASTPTVEIAVKNENAVGGIIITASHNPKNWNALKLLNNKGEFLNQNDGKIILEYAEKAKFLYSNIDKIGKVSYIDYYDDIHIDSILKLDLVNSKQIKKQNYTVAIDCVNSVGGIIIPKLLEKLGVKNIVKLYCTPNGDFPHDPEPIAENLSEISNLIKNQKIDVGFVVDPDVDRLAIICEDASMFGEEYSLVAVADYVLSKNPGNTVSNISSTKALKDITEKYGQTHYSTAVGEVNVVEKMKEVSAVIGGEGNGGIIYPELHYGRDALVGIALFLSLLSEKKINVSLLKKTYPKYYISKNKIQLNKNIDINKIFDYLKNKYKKHPQILIDGLKIEFQETKEWVHLRKSNTEPIIRIYAESNKKQRAIFLTKIIIDDIVKLCN